MLTRITVLNWVKTFPDFFTRHAQAREAQAHYLVEETLDTVRLAKTPEEMTKARLMLDATKWMAGKLAPKSYGDLLEGPLSSRMSPGVATQGPSDIVLARQLMYLVHRVMVRQAKEAEPGPPLVGVERQSRP
jgi:Bacteriophage Sf6, terminase small subunit-like